MKHKHNYETGSISLVVIIILLVVTIVLLGYVVFNQQKNNKITPAASITPTPTLVSKSSTTPTPTPSSTAIPTPADDRVHHELGFTYKNPDALIVSFQAQDAGTYRPFFASGTKVHYDVSIADWVYDDTAIQREKAGSLAELKLLNQTPTKIWDVTGDGFSCSTTKAAFYREGKIIIITMPQVCSADFLNSADGASQKATSLVSGADTDLKFKMFYASITLE